MALKKGILDSYIKERETPKTGANQLTQNDKYSHNRVFDEPESLKKALGNLSNEEQVSTPKHITSTLNVAPRTTKQDEIKPLKKDKKPVTKPVTNGSQTSYKRFTNAPQGTNIPDSTDNNRLTKDITNGLRTVHNPFPQSVLPRLTGIQRSIIIAIYKNCRLNGGNTTQELTLDYIASITSTNKKSIKTSINRLKNKSCISMVDYKDGRGGWVKYEISKQLFTELLQHEGIIFPNHNATQTVNNLVTQPTTEPITSFSSSSSNYIKTTTTDLPHEWKQIDFAPLAKINFGITELKNIYRKCPEHINHEIVQDSINQFAFGLANNAERYKSMNAPSGILVKTLSEGTSWQEAGYISLEEKQRVEKENKVTKLLETQFKEPKFLEWFSTLDEREKENLVPQGVKSSTSYMISNVIIQKEHAKKHFEQSIWPLILSEIKGTL